MLLYDSPVSGNCYKVRLLLAKLGLPYERRTVDVVDRSNRPELLGDLNPSLRVPTLVLDDGTSLGESGAILWYFGEGTRFVPDDRYERAQVLQWMFFEQYDLEPSIVLRSARGVRRQARRAHRRRLPRPRRPRETRRLARVARRRLDHPGRRLAVRLHARRRRRRLRAGPVPGDRRVARSRLFRPGARSDRCMTRLTGSSAVLLVGGPVDS
jgi:glutathione S-transferase